ncbi:MAG: hypothetical protein JNK90_02915 [Planctomycetaceae bacterium]|nr:hypothetical protein [Planctomycetaceae bacterium]
MNEVSFCSRIALGLFLCSLWSNLCWGQATITTNEAIEGRISKPRETQEWTVELPEDGTIELSVRSKAFKMLVFMYRDDKPITLLPVNNLGGRTHSWGVGGQGEIRCKPEKELPFGRYRIQVRSARDNEIGKYEIQIHDPSFVEPEPQKGSGVSEEESIRDFLKRLDSKLVELEKRIKELEKRGSGR